MFAVFCAFLIVIGGIFVTRQKAPILTSNPNTPALNEAVETTSIGNVISNNKLNINLATAEDFEMLPGIGEVLAKRIVAYRTIHGPFDSVDTLLEIKGIVSTKLDAIRPYITVD